LRFNSADSAYLNRTPASAGNRKTWTWSGWIKRGTLGTLQTLFGINVVQNDSQAQAIFFGSDDKLKVIPWTDNNFVSNAVFRDPSAWYHIVVAFDSTNATANNRVIVYVNNINQSGTYPLAVTLNADYGINQAGSHRLGDWPASGFNTFGGYMTEVNFIDGQALTPSSFGETNSQTGVWQPKAYSGSYGTNGFYLNFSNNSNTTAATLGADYSGNGNNWTPNNFSVTAGAGNDSLVDVPTPYGVDTGAGGTVRGNYATLNPLYKSTNVTASNGNLDAVSIAQVQTITSTFFLSNGKWYAEFLCNANGLEDMLGIIQNTFDISSGSFYVPTQILFGRLGNVLYYSGSSVITSPSWVTGDTLQLALDLDNQTLAIAKNGGSFNTITITSYDSHVAGQFWSFGIKNGASGGSGNFNYTANFGQRPFAYTAPSGFKALCTQNLPTPTIGATTATQADKYFTNLLWTSTASTQVITGSNFQPDLVWLKSRTSNSGNEGWHHLVDAVRTPQGGVLATNSADSTFWSGAVPISVSAFNSNGFTAGYADGLNGNPMATWLWKANGTGSTNTAGSITSTVSANTTSGFSIVSYVGVASSPVTIGHGLGVAPSFIIVKNRDVNAAWYCYHSSLGANTRITLNLTSAAFVGTGLWNGTAPSSTVFSTVADTTTNNTGNKHIAYCFSAIAGYSAFGSYVGNGSADGAFAYTGFRPAFILVKASSGTSAASANWLMLDDTRNTSNVVNNKLAANLAEPENTGSIGDSTQNNYDFLSNGFKARTTNGSSNESGTTYIYAAFAENPFKYSLAR